MQNKHAIFIIGSPGSGKDVVIRDISTNYNIVEFTSTQIDEMLKEDSSFKRAKVEKRNSLLERNSIIVTANSFDLGFIVTKSILEYVGYTSHLILVEADLAISYNRLSNRSNLKESIEKISIANNNKSSILSLFDSKIIVNNSKSLDLSECRVFVSNILDELKFESDIVLEQIVKVDFKSKIKKLNPKVPDTGADAVGDQCIAGMTGALGESITEPDVSGYGYTAVASGPMQNTTSSTVYQGSDQDKESMNSRFKSLNKRLKSLKLVQPKIIDNV